MGNKVPAKGTRPLGGGHGQVNRVAAIVPYAGWPIRAGAQRGQRESRCGGAEVRRCHDPSGA